MSESSIVVVCAALVTILTLWIKSYFDRKAVEATAKDAAGKASSAVEKAAAAVGEVKVAVDGIDRIREMVDGQRTAMIAELKAATAKIVDLEKIILSQRETAAARKAKET